ncbi:dynamin family protein [Ornithinibacillus scapharcae]|uniref:dynamin family protein n=1 Tax=Ornithinibacillus scapharcae TaxID=1147159 RepID=UPI000225B350|nr:dynamin family protein [Ornithinibacillus scapharcae]
MRAIKENASVLEYENLIGIYHVLQQNGDVKNANKIIDLYKKKQIDEYVLSFTGHFSAGKSSIINAVIGTEILPKSPIPTSANIVKLTSGEGVARVYFYNDEPIEYDEPYDLDMIKEYCKDKDIISKIEISSKQDIIPNNCAILDTPGIDAADDTDRIITESSLHLVDVLFYVMDYNHVQSEMNLTFLKNIQSMNIPFYIIINQIDKHNEKELTFQQFEESVKQTFEQWRLSPEEIYFSSLMKMDSPHNQLAMIKEKISQLFHDQRIQRIDASVRHIMAEHKKYLEEMHQVEASTLYQAQQDESVLIKVEDIQHKLERLENIPNELKKDYNTNLDQTLKNAYLMPANIRDQALNFLESQQKEFKVGLIGSKKKTEEEKARRMADFLAMVQEGMQTNIQWKLREKIGELLRSYSITNHGILAKVQHLSVSLLEDDLMKLIKRGAKINGDYVLNYTNELGHLIKTKYRIAARNILTEILATIEVELSDKINQYQNELKKHQKILHSLEQYKLMEQQLHNRINLLEEQLYAPNYPKEIENILEKKLAPIDYIKGTNQLNISSNPIELQEHLNETVSDSNGSVPTTQQVINALEKTIHFIQELPPFQSLVTELTFRKEKLQNRQMTISLFGAFSAGKSSFANALIGEGILPSSPNPTTAVINRIIPVTEQYKHGTVRIHLKNEDTIKKDLISILKYFNPPEMNDLENFMDWIDQHKIHQQDKLSKMFQSYVLAIVKGYNDHRDTLGQSLTIELSDFVGYVTDESKACFVESIDLYYDCSITQKGITLVDTPGADSVNARHTNVAFDYIKNADAILYVTYYNHAITKADKDFVMQLGRVKDSFQLDKMFFIINAADLAKDDSELTLVVNYVKEQLQKLGVRNPRLYPVSSKVSLEEKLAAKPVNQQITSFEQDFYSFLDHELSQLAVKSAIHEIERTERTFRHYLQKANLSIQEKENYKSELVTRKEQLVSTVTSTDGRIYFERIQDKISKQLHYVIERNSIRFHDMFKDKFNPTTITESGRKGMEQFEINLIDLLDYIGYELLQEARAVSLRVEAFIQEQFDNLIEVYQLACTDIDHDFTIPAFEIEAILTPEYKQPLQQLDIQIFQKAFSLFKGTKSFFEKNEKEKVKEEIYRILLPEIHHHIQQLQQEMINAYDTQWNKLFEQMGIFLQSKIEEYVNNSLAVLDDTIDINVLEQKQLKIVELLASIR